MMQSLLRDATNHFKMWLKPAAISHQIHRRVRYERRGFKYANNPSSPELLKTTSNFQRPTTNYHRVRQSLLRDATNHFKMWLKPAAISHQIHRRDRRVRRVFEYPNNRSLVIAAKKHKKRKSYWLILLDFEQKGTKVTNNI